MSEMPLVSITIPTRNSSKTLDYCLRCVVEQDYPNLEIVIIDSNSTDATLEIANSYRVKILRTEWRLLGARYLGAIEAKGEYVVLLDSDQFLEKDCISRAVKKVLGKNLVMLCLEESSHSKSTWIEKLFEADRMLINSQPDVQLDHTQGTVKSD